jgi:hypothetical protein
VRSSSPTLHCDNCPNWSLDFYEQSASEVGGVRITAEHRAPGWGNTNLSDLCPDCAPKARP